MKKPNLFHSLSKQEDYFSSDEKQQHLKEAIDRLPVDAKRIIQLYYFECLTVKEIASEMKYSVSSIYNQLNKTLFQLKEEINPRELEEIYRILYPENKKPVSFIDTSSVSE